MAHSLVTNRILIVESFKLRLREAVRNKIGPDSLVIVNEHRCRRQNVGFLSLIVDSSGLFDDPIAGLCCKIDLHVLLPVGIHSSFRFPLRYLCIHDIRIRNCELDYAVHLYITGFSLICAIHYSHGAELCHSRGSRRPVVIVELDLIPVGIEIDIKY